MSKSTSFSPCSRTAFCLLTNFTIQISENTFENTICWNAGYHNASKIPVSPAHTRRCCYLVIKPTLEFTSWFVKPWGDDSFNPSHMHTWAPWSFRRRGWVSLMSLTFDCFAAKMRLVNLLANSWMLGAVVWWFAAVGDMIFLQLPVVHRFVCDLGTSNCLRPPKTLVHHFPAHINPKMNALISTLTHWYIDMLIKILIYSHGSAEPGL